MLQCCGAFFCGVFGSNFMFYELMGHIILKLKRSYSNLITYRYLVLYDLNLLMFSYIVYNVSHNHHTCVLLLSNFITDCMHN